MSLHHQFDDKKPENAVLTQRDIILRAALSICTEEELASVETDIARFERTGIMSRRIIRIVAAAKPAKRRY